MTSTVAMSLAPPRTLYGTRLVSSGTSGSRRPMKRLIEKTVFVGLVTACRLATVPTRRSPSFVKPTTDGVTRPPSAFGMTTGSPPSITATTEFVVPRSIPMIFSAIVTSFVFRATRVARRTRDREGRAAVAVRAYILRGHEVVPRYPQARDRAFAPVWQEN